MKRSNIITGFVILGIAFLFIIEPWLIHGKMAELSLVPLWESIFLVITALWLIASNLKGSSLETVEWPTGDGRRMILHLVIALIGYLLLVEVLGFYTSTFLFMIMASIAWRRYSWRFLALVAASYCVFLFLVFDFFLKMALPRSLTGLP